MRIALSGSTGLVGAALGQSLRADGHDVVRLVRSPDGKQDSSVWDPATGSVDANALGTPDAVVHLAGENIASGRWTAAKKQLIDDSRGPATELLCKTLAALPTPPKVFIGASATGIYGNTGGEEVHEDTPIELARGENFLVDVARDWEAGARPIADAGARVVHLRIGIVLSKQGGALKRMLTPFRMGVGGRLGDGRQWMSWIALPDLLRIAQFALANDQLHGPLLCVAPTPVTNREFTRILGKVLRRPTVLPAPAFALRMAFGEMADALLLTSLRTRPQRLLEAGFEFEHPNLETALRALLT